MTRPSVFLSYSSRDRDVAGRVERALKRLGLAAFNPARDVHVGEHWRKAIQAAIKRADALVLLATSPQSAASSWMAYEAGVAEALGKPVMILLPDKYPVTELPADFAAGQVLDFDPEAPERAAREIVDRLVPA
jgi:nucleoside 2-deoxyribosyltransferase